MPTLAAARAALAAQLTAHLPDGVRVLDALPDQLNPPAVVVRRALTTYDTTQGGQSNDLALAVVVFLQFASQRSAQVLLDEFVSTTGDRSVYAAVNADPTLGGLVAWAVCTEAGPDEVVQYQDVDYLSATITVLVS
jgi:hypothetical protein